jgi:rubrerythrin
LFKRSNLKSGNTEIVDLLGQIIKLEYSMIVNYPRLAQMIKDKETQDLTNALGIASMRHADVASKALAQLGGNPRWSFEGLAGELDLKSVFDKQLEKEILALNMHRQCAGLTQDRTLKTEFLTMAEEEKAHIKTVEKIIGNLRAGADERELKTARAGIN